MKRATLDLAARLADAGQPFALVTVVWRRGPSSGKEGSTAIIRPDGSVRGWLGGACAEPTVVREALAAMGDGTPRLMFLGPADELDGRDRPGITSVPMACESEGAMEVYVEPVMPRPHLVVIGRSPAVTALARMAAALDWRATVVDDGGSRDEWPQDVEVFTTLDLGALDVGGGTFVVVATQGHYDEAALEAALRTEAGHIGLVASRKRADGVLEYLRSRGLDDEALARIRAPAGLDLGSLDHVEIAVAVLAELVALRAGGGLRAGVAVVAPLQAIDPVCEMTVDVATARYVTVHEGQDHYFCAAGCQRAFEEQPQRFLAPKDATN